MKNRILFGTILALLLVGSVSFADDDADKKRLLEEYDKITKEKAKEAERMAKENLQAAETTEVAVENGEVVATEEEQIAQAPKKARKELSLVACTDQKVVNYNTARLDVIEDYLKNHKYVKPSENLDKLMEEGKIEYAEEYVSLEKEAKQWEREKTQQ